MPAFAAEMPSRKAGLWEVKTAAAGGQAIQMKQCIDAKTDQAMQAGAGAGSANCSKRDAQTTPGGGMTIDTACTIAGKTMTSHIVVTGSFDSEYQMTITSQGDALPKPRTTTVNAKWLGPCAADQKGGDVIMPNGTKINVLDMQMGRPGAGGAPPGH